MCTFNVLSALLSLKILHMCTLVTKILHTLEIIVDEAQPLSDEARKIWGNITISDMKAMAMEAFGEPLRGSKESMMQFMSKRFVKDAPAEWARQTGHTFKTSHK